MPPSSGPRTCAATARLRRRALRSSASTRPAPTARWDGDTGPIVAGLGTSASAFALAAARAEGDTATAEALRRTGELLGLPAVSWWGKRYLGGAVPLVDIFALWTRTVPMPAASPAPAVAWPLVIGLAAFWLAIAAAQIKGARRAWHDLGAAVGGTAFQAVLLAATALALALHPRLGGVLGSVPRGGVAGGRRHRARRRRRGPGAAFDRAWCAVNAFKGAVLDLATARHLPGEGRAEVALRAGDWPAPRAGGAACPRPA